MIKSGTVVNLAYKLTNMSGETLDEATAADPMTYLHGSGQIVPGLEEALEGLKSGDKKQVTVSPEDGYGELNPDLKLTVKRTQFPQEMQLEEGMQFESETPDGHGLVFTVEKLEGDQVSINGNHPLAGVTLCFDVTVLSIREATSEELSHGHAHGGDGHHH